MFKPAVIAADFETTDLMFWREDFRVLSAAFSWYVSDGSVKHRFVQGEAETGRQLQIIAEQGIPLIAHNVQFEIGVHKARYPHIDIGIWQIDTMRLAQNYDNGGREAKTEPQFMSIEDELKLLQGGKTHSTGLGLQAVVSRVLPKEWHNHKEKYYKWLRDNRGVKKGQEGANLHQLPNDLLAAYNVADTDVTLLLYTYFTDYFKQQNFNWQFDHALHINECKRFADAKIRGIRVDREGLAEDLTKVEGEIEQILNDFKEFYRDEIEAIERERTKAFIGGVKSDHGKTLRHVALQNNTKSARKAVDFNPGSTKQLEELLVNKLGIKPTFWTKESKASQKKRKINPDLKPFEPRPSFRATHLPSYGEGALILQNRKKRQLVSLQQGNLLKLSEPDGRWHAGLRACGTKTSRYAGSSDGDVKLNVQGLARREPLLMKHLIADEGCTFVSVDLAAGEPTVVAHYSQDQNYRNAAFEMVGKAPYWDANGVLQIDDQYLQGASVSPVGNIAMKEAWNTTYNGKSFAEQWLEDPEVIKKELKKDRAFHKILILALMYGLKPKGAVSHAYDNGFDLAFKDAKAFYHAFWYQLYPGVRILGERLETLLQRQGYLVNQFGYRMTPERSSLALNYTIQSSVSGIMKILQEKFYSLADYAHPVCIVHDELILQIPKTYVEKCRQDMQAATESMNQDLNWSVAIRTGFVTGDTLYDAK